MGLEKLDENSMLNCRRYIEESLLDIENSISRLSNIKTPYGDVNDLIMFSKSNIRDVENELNNLSYKLGSDIIEKINNIDVDFIPTNDLLTGYDYFAETSDTPLEDYILYVLENGSIDDVSEICSQLDDDSTCYLLDKKYGDVCWYEKENGQKNYFTKSNLIYYLVNGIVCKDTEFGTEEKWVKFFKENTSKEFYDTMYDLANRYSGGLRCFAYHMVKLRESAVSGAVSGTKKILSNLQPLVEISSYNFNPSIYVPKVKNKGFLFPQHELEFELEYNLVPNWYDNNVAYKETFSIKGNDVTIIQIFPGEKGEYSFFADIPTISLAERILSDKYKLEVLKKLDSIPVRVFDSFDTDLTIVLPYDRDVSNYDSDTWGGYYSPTNKGVIWLDTGIKNSGNYDEWVIESALPHEIGHKFDRSYSNDYMNLLDKFLYNITHETNDNTEASTWTSETTKFNDYAQKYAVEVDSIEGSGYTPDDLKNNVVEFFACSFDAYINKPDELKTLCPEVYDVIEQMIEGTWQVHR